MRFMRPMDRLLWWRRAASAPSLTPGTATVTLDASEEWSPGGVTGANPLLPLVFRLYGNGGNGSEPTGGGQGGQGGGGGAFVTGSRAAWTAEDSFAITIGTPSVPGTSVVGNTPTVSDVSVLAGGGEDAGLFMGGTGSITYQTNGLTSTTTYAGGDGGSSINANGAGGGASGSVDGAGNSGGPFGGGGAAASADGGNGGEGGPSDGSPGNSPGGGGSGAGDGFLAPGDGANGRIVILVPTLT